MSQKLALGQPVSDAEATILGLIESTNPRFRYISIDPDPSLHKQYNVPHNTMLSVDCATDSPSSLEDAVLIIGQNILEGIYHVYRMCPQIVRNAISFAVEHEAAHVEGIYSAAHLIRRKYAYPKSLACYIECDCKANLQAMTTMLKLPGMTFEKLEDDVAASVWLIGARAYEYPDINAGELSSYIEECFPRLGEEFKEQIIEKISEIDAVYRNAIKQP